MESGWTVRIPCLSEAGKRFLDLCSMLIGWPMHGKHVTLQPTARHSPDPAASGLDGLADVLKLKTGAFKFGWLVVGVHQMVLICRFSLSRSRSSVRGLLFSAALEA